MASIVVGTDGSEQAQSALAWAVDEARRRSAHLDVLHVWEAPLNAYPAPFFATGAFEVEACIRASRQAAEQRGEEIRSWLREHAADVGATVSVIEGSAGDQLLEHAKTAALLVVGSRGHGGFSALLLGSVSDRCSRHAPCPIVIVPAPARTKAAA